MNAARKRWISFDFQADVKNSPKETALGKRNSVEEKTHSTKTSKPILPVVKKRSFNFQDQLKPQTVTDLAVHPKKVKEVELWLQDHVVNKSDTKKTANFLLITGPTGSGKTATVHVLCRSLSISISEWTNPVDQDFETFKGLNQVSRFTEFLTESKWNSLFSNNNRKVSLVEDFPNALVRNPEEFQTVLDTCYYVGNPVVFICTDSFDSGMNMSQKLFTDEIKAKYKIFHISFNSCAVTLMKNALQRAHNLAKDNADLFKIPSPSTMDSIIATAMGDIRCAVNQYYFASLLGTADLPSISDKITKAGTKRKRGGNSAASSIKSMCRDENLGLFHGLGRVLNPKRIESGNSWKFNCDLEKLIEEFSTQPSIFTAFLFENYIRYFGDLNDASTAAEYLSLSQTFLEKWIDRHETLIYALWISVMGLMICNEHKISRWNQIKGPVKTKKRINNDPQTRDLSVTDLFYYNVINKNHKSHFRVNL